MISSVPPPPPPPPLHSLSSYKPSAQMKHYLAYEFNEKEKQELNESKQASVEQQLAESERNIENISRDLNEYRSRAISTTSKKGETRIQDMGDKSKE